MASLTARDLKKVDTYAYHEPKSAELFYPDSIGVISIFRYGRNATEDGLKRIGTNFKVRFERAKTDEAIKIAKQVVKQLNSGTYTGKDVVCVPTGRPRGRQKAAV